MSVSVMRFLSANIEEAIVCTHQPTMQPAAPAHASMQETCSAAVWVSHDATWRALRGCSSCLTTGDARVKVARVKSVVMCFSCILSVCRCCWVDDIK